MASGCNLPQFNRNVACSIHALEIFFLPFFFFAFFLCTCTAYNQLSAYLVLTGLVRVNRRSPCISLLLVSPSLELLLRATPFGECLQFSNVAFFWKVVASCAGSVALCAHMCVFIDVGGAPG